MKLYNPIIEKGRDLTAADRELIVSPAHDKPGRSAALLWESLFEIEGVYVPQSVYRFFKQTEPFSNINFLESIPEHHSAFDNLGKGRMHDLLIQAQWEEEKIIIAVEAKVDEPFDNQTIKEYRTTGEATLTSGKNSNKPARISKLIKAIFPEWQHSEVENLKYQLLQATAGTLAEAKTRNAAKAIFCVLNFKPMEPGLDYSTKNALNSKNMDDFFRAFTNVATQQMATNQLHGPFYVPGDADIPSDIPLYFLKLEQVFNSPKN